jgi:hypothetical protein
MTGQVTDAEFDHLKLSDVNNPCDFASGPEKPAGAAFDLMGPGLGVALPNEGADC